MPEAIKSTLRRAKGFFLDTERKRFILPVVVTVVVITVGIVVAVLLNRETYTALYSGLSAEEAGTIMSVLEEMGVSAKAKGTDVILVPEDQADELRIALAARGYPDTGLNYDLFSNSSALGSTDLERQTYLQYQLQENMRATISKMNKIKGCVVIVNLAATSSFVMSGNVSEASVAVLLELNEGEALSASEAKAIGQFVVKCVPRLKLENVSIVDSDMKYYDMTGEGAEAADMPYSDARQVLTEQMKQVLTEQALRVLEPALGEGNVAVSVNLNLDFDKETVHSVEFAPPLEGETQGMILSSEELYDAINPGLIQGAAGQPGTDSNGVSAPEYVSDAEADSGGSYSRTYNYELNRIQTQIEKAQGTVRELSVAVLVNSEVEGASGHLDTMKNLVANAIGVDSDYISVELMPFVERAGEAGFGDYFRQNQEALNKLRQTELLKTIVVSAAALLGLAMVLLYTGRKRRREEAGDELVTAGGPAGGPTPGELLNDPEARAEQDRLLQELMHKQSDENERVGELIDRYPDAVIQILRTWLMEED